jgi:hypothetical protein
LLKVAFDDGTCQVLGDEPNQWLLGVGSVIRKPFAISESHLLFDAAEQFFEAARLGSAVIDASQGDSVQLSLL